MSYDMIAILMFSSMMVMMATGQRVFGAIGFVAVAASVLLWGVGGSDLGFSAAMKLMKWYPLLTLPMFIFMGYVLSESRLADDLYRMFHVWFGPVPGGLAIGTIFLMVIISAMNGLSVAGMAIGATIALPELLKRGYDKRMVTGVIQAGSSLGILIPPSVVLVLYAMIARQPVSLLWLAGVFPGLMMAGMFMVYIWIRCKLNPELGPPLSADELRPDPPGREDQAALRRRAAARHLPSNDGAVRDRLHLAGRGIGDWRARLRPGRCLQGPLHPQSLRDLHPRDALHLLHVHVDHPRGARVRRGLRRARCGEGHRGLFVDRLALSPWTILILMQLSYLVMGTFLDDTAMLVIVAPLYVPLVSELDLGIDKQYVLIWYGVLYTITCQVAYMTPPFGYNLFLMRAMAPPEINIIDIYRSIVPFVCVMILALILVLAFPEIALWLPQHVNAR